MTLPQVLIVENNDGVRALICEKIAPAGYETTEASVPMEAESKAKDKKFDAAVVDVRLKDDNDPFDRTGLTLARKLGAMGIKVIILSSHDSFEDEERAYYVAPGVPRISAFISKNPSDWEKKLIGALAEVTKSSGILGWLRKNWETVANLVVKVVKKLVGM